MRRNIALALALTLAAPAFSQLLGDEALTALQDRARAAPGSEVRYETPSNDSYILVYVPTDYDPDAPTPVIFCYHGFKGRPTTWPFRQATDGKGFLIVGMEYGSEDYANRPRIENMEREEPHYRAVLKLIAGVYSIDNERLFMGGFSQGGYSTSVFGETLLGELRGLIILGAARAYVDGRPPPTRAISRFPVFVGCGVNDETHFPRAQYAVRVYEGWGADVAYEWWKDIGHSFDRRKSAELGAWLRRYAGKDEPDASPLRARIR